MPRIFRTSLGIAAAGVLAAALIALIVTPQPQTSKSATPEAAASPATAPEAADSLAAAVPPSAAPSAAVAPIAGPLGSGPLRTDGGNIVDADGRVVRITGINWFGLETSTFAPQGLWARGLNEMLAKRLRLTVQQANPLANLTVRDGALESLVTDEIAPLLMLPIGLALRQVA